MITGDTALSFNNKNRQDEICRPLRPRLTWYTFHNGWKNTSANFLTRSRLFVLPRSRCLSFLNTEPYNVSWWSGEPGIGEAGWIHGMRSMDRNQQKTKSICWRGHSWAWVISMGWAPEKVWTQFEVFIAKCPQQISSTLDVEGEWLQGGSPTIVIHGVMGSLLIVLYRSYNPS